MPHGNNRAAARPKASFQIAAGVSIKYRHPTLAWQISGALPIDEIDVTDALRLNETFFNAVPLQNGAVIEPLVGGGTVTITNHLTAGRVTLQVLETTGFVGAGDFIAALHLVKVSKDAEGGTLTVTRMFNGRKRIRVYYGVGVENVPDEIIAGNSLAPYAVTLTYGGWFEGAGGLALSAKTVWGVGNKYGIKGIYRPYSVQLAEGTENGGMAKAYFDGAPAGSVIGGEGSGEAVDTGDVIEEMISADAAHESVTLDESNPHPTW
jgi:hypothetical protein